MWIARVAICVSSALAFALPAHAVEKPEECAAMQDGGERLLCYDAIFRIQTTVEPPTGSQSKWIVQTAKSKIDDSKSVFLFLESDEDVPGRFGRGAAKASMVVRCMEGKTAITLQFADHFMADNGGYGDVVFRVDDKKAFTKSLSESTDHTALGLFSGATSIPLIKTLFGGNRLIIRVMPFNESALTVSYAIAGLETDIKPLREACKW
ncbi:type VI secretion protein [Agrobacterium sp. SHOUNA12C]|nr:type VI secretion protein [Agrobacterium sp. BETTINA12B]MCJ9761277.1 type VI secretion protein [Agrobacterium sp. SHOUNA12C]